MASTGTALFTLTRLQLMTQAHLAMRVLMAGQTLSTAQINQAAVELNIMLKNWAVKGLKLWCYQQVLVPMVANQVVYTIGPVGANVTTVRPLRVFNEGNFIRYTTNGLPYDMPLRLISRAEYEEFGAKLSTGVPNSIYYFPGIDVASGVTSPSTGYGTLYVYVGPSNTALPRTIYLNAQRPIYDMTNDTDEFDLPSEWFEAVKFGLMERLLDYFEVPEERIMRIMQRAASTLEDASGWSAEQAPMQIVPDYTAVRRYR